MGLFGSRNFGYVAPEQLVIGGLIQSPDHLSGTPSAWLLPEQGQGRPAPPGATLMYIITPPVGCSVPLGGDIFSVADPDPGSGAF